MPQLVQSLRYDERRLVEGYLLRAAQRSDIFAHILIWHLQGESVHEVKDGTLNKTVEKDSGRELEKIKMQGEELYLPTAPNKLVRGIQVGDDCRQDVLALQVISLLRDIFQAVGLNLYLFPYGVLPTGAERGIIEVVPNTRSRSQMGETTDGGLYEIFHQNYGPVGSTTFETARENFLISSAGYAVASLLLQPKDRHNGNLLFDDVGRIVHIDFGFILETSPGGNMRFESAHLKLSHEMTQLLDPSGVMKSKTWHQFVSLCVKGYLAARRYMDRIISTVEMMLDSG